MPYWSHLLVVAISSGAKNDLHRGGTAKASAVFQNQFDAVISDTAFALIMAGKISAG